MVQNPYIPRQNGHRSGVINAWRRWLVKVRGAGDERDTLPPPPPPPLFFRTSSEYVCRLQEVIIIENHMV